MLSYYYFLDILKHMELEIPLWQVGIYIVLSSTFTVMRRLQLSIVNTYLFTLFWVFILNSSKFGETEQEKIFFTSLFILCGIITTGLAVWYFYNEDDTE